MKHVKKLLSVILALALCMGLAVPAFAAEKPEFEIAGTTLKKYNGAGGKVTIPAGITTIADGAFSRNKTVTDVTMPDSVTSIGGSAFYSCEALKNVYLSNNLTSIGNSAFNNCTSLTCIVLPNSVTSIGRSAFAYCSSMKTLNLSNSLVSMGDWAFRDCTSLTSVSVPGSVSVVPENAFNGCSSVKTVVLYEGVTKTEANAFRNCTSMTTLTLPTSIKEVGTATFASSKGLRDVYYGGSEEQWEAIKGDFLGSNLPNWANIHYNSPMPEPAPSFNDVSVSTWYSAPVAWASGSSIANGTGGGKFDPAQDCTQAQILTFLYRGARNAQSDLPVAASGADMDAAVEWAREKGMIDGSFNGSAPCTRSTAVYYIWMAFNAPAASGSSFSDVPDWAGYATAVSWAVQKGVTDGTGNGKFSPDDVCNRGQIVTFLYRAYV